MKFCPVCKYYLYLNVVGGELERHCKNCTYHEKEYDGGLIVENIIQEKASEAYKVYLNEFTKEDPTLPHLDNIKCPNGSCASNNQGAKSDVIYIKYDATNMKFLYICNVCDEKWKSR